MKLLYLEWLKVRRSRFFWIASLAIFGLLALTLLFVGDLNILGQKSSPGQNAGNFDQSLAELGIYQLPLAWANLAYLAGFFKIFASLVLILLVTQEYQFRTIRQNVIDGLSKKQFYLSKVGLLLTFSLGLTLFTGLISAIQIAAHPQPEDLAFWSGMEALVLLAVEYIFCFALAIFLAWLLRRSAPAILFFLLYYFILEELLYLLLDAPLQDWLPTQAGKSLLEQPFTRLTNLDSILGMESREAFPWKDFLRASGYSLLFLVGGYWVFHKRDL